MQELKRGQRVKIIPIEDDVTLSKCPDINQHTGETGRITGVNKKIKVGAVLTGLKEPLPPQPVIERICYDVILDEGNNVVKIPHEALELAK